MERPELHFVYPRDRHEVQIRRWERRAQHRRHWDLRLIYYMHSSTSTSIHIVDINGPTSQLRTTKHVRQERIIVKSPHAMAPRRLQPIHVLETPAQADVPHERAQHDLPLNSRRGVDKTHEREAEQEERKRRLVARAVVHAREGTERREEVGCDVRDAGVEGSREERLEECVAFLWEERGECAVVLGRVCAIYRLEAFTPRPEREVAKPLWGWKRRDLVDPFIQLIQELDYRSDALSEHEPIVSVTQR